MYNKKKIGVYKAKINKYSLISEEVFDKMTFSEIKKLANQISFIESLCNELDEKIAGFQKRGE